jgi:hypothetical protein
MGVKENLGVVGQDYQAQKDKVMEMGAGLDQKITLINDTMAEYDQDMALAAQKEKDAYDKGFNDGLIQANQANGSDKIYSDAEMNDEKAKDKADADARVSAVQSIADDLQAKLAQANQEKADTQALVESMKAELDQAKADAQVAKDALSADAQKDAEIAANIQAQAEQLKQ